MMKDLFEKAPPDVRKLRAQAKRELRKQERAEWKLKNEKKMHRLPGAQN